MNCAYETRFHKLNKRNCSFATALLSKPNPNSTQLKAYRVEVKQSSNCQPNPPPSPHPTATNFLATS